MLNCDVKKPQRVGDADVDLGKMTGMDARLEFSWFLHKRVVNLHLNIANIR